MNTLNLACKIFIGILLLVLITGSILLFSQQETAKTRITFGDEEKIITLHSPDRYVYHAKVSIKGDLSCDRQVQILQGSKRYNQPIQLKEGRVNEIIFDGDWYSEDLGVEFFSTSDNCAENEIKVTVTFYGEKP
jgi:hypothetical protein